MVANAYKRIGFNLMNEIMMQNDEYFFSHCIIIDKSGFNFAYNISVAISLFVYT